MNGIGTSIRIVCVAGEKPAVDALYDYAAYVGCSFGLFKVSVELNQKPMTPWSTNMAAVQMGNSLDFVALRAEVSRGAASSLTYADG
jgi:hypothetical protein